MYRTKMRNYSCERIRWKDEEGGDRESVTAFENDTIIMIVSSQIISEIMTSLRLVQSMHWI